MRLWGRQRICGVSQGVLVCVCRPPGSFRAADRRFSM